MKNIAPHYFVLTTWLFMSALCYPDFTKANDIEHAEFMHISTEHGLSQKSVQTIYQDANGFIWLGTQEGLNRYDGREIKVFRHLNSDKNSISHDFIRDIVEDQNGNFWVATGGGLNRFIGSSESFELVAINDISGKKVEKINTLFVDSRNEFWIGSDGNGLFKMEPNKDEFIVNPVKKFKNLNSFDIRVIFEDTRGRLWVGTDGNGVVLINQSRNDMQFFTHDSADTHSLSHNQIRSITEDHKGQIWIATLGGGVSRFNELSKNFKRYEFNNKDSNSLSHNRVYKILEDSEQRIWMATDAGISIYKDSIDGFNRIEPKASQPSSLNHNRVLSLFQDNGGLIWIGTSSGINIWNPVAARFVHYQHSGSQDNSLTNNHVHGFAQNSEGLVYVATLGGGLNLFDPSINQFVPNKFNYSLDKTSDQYLTTLMFDNEKQRLWSGTFSNGVDIINENGAVIESFRHQLDDPTSLSDNAVTDIIKDVDGEIWVSTYRGGLNRLKKDGSGFKRYRLSEEEHGLKNENIFQIMEDDDGYIWMVTDGGGLIRLDKHSGQFTSFLNDPTNEQSLSGNTTWSIFQDSKRRFWIGTQGNGLNLWLPENRRQGVNQFKHYTLENGLNGSTVNGVIEDNNGNMWISTNRGVSQLDPETDRFTHYNLAAEIHDNEFNQGALLKLSDGRFFFGGLKGISAFYPNEVINNQNIAKVLLTNISSEGRDISFNIALNELNEVFFTHEDYLITFEFAGLDFAQPSKNQYQYKLEGLDSDWVKIGNLNRATFTNLPSGTYTLKVKASNNDGVWSDASINLKVIVKPAPWATWWAYSIYTGLFSLLLLLVVRAQAKRLANQEMFRNLVSEQVEEKTALYIKNNEFLNEQMEQLILHSNVDLDTGLPNQKYLCDLVKANLQWINQFGFDTNENTVKLCVALLRLPATGNLLAADANGLIVKIAKAFSKRSDSLELGFKEVVRWGERELGVIFYADNQAEGDRFVNVMSQQLIDILTEILNQDFSKSPVKVGYTMTPFSGVAHDPIDSVDLLMLTEHMLHFVIKEQNIDVAGVVGTKQKLTQHKFRQIMSVKNLNELNELVYVSSHKFDEYR